MYIPKYNKRSFEECDNNKTFYVWNVEYKNANFETKASISFYVHTVFQI